MEEGRRRRAYIRLAELPAVAERCESWQELQAMLLAGRRDHRRLLRETRSFFRIIERLPKT